MIDVSIVIPCRNERDTIEACLDAIAAQDYPASRFEVLVVDGQSTDGSCDVLRARGLRILRDPGRGPAAARNVGIHHARGRIVAFTDADCVPRFDWLSRLVDPLNDAPDVGGVAGAMRMTRDTLLGRMEDNDARVHYRGYITSNIAYRRDVLLEVGGFDETLLCAEDYDLAWRVLDAGHRIERAPEAVVRHHPPELAGPPRRYLAKQFWYARMDVPAHARALARAWRARGRSPGSTSALAGGLDALHASAWFTGAALGVLLKAPVVVAGTLAGASLTAARHVVHTVADVGEGAWEAAPMVALETTKRLVRGAGTLVGLADLARSRASRRLTPVVSSSWARAPALPEPIRG